MQLTDQNAVKPQMDADKRGCGGKVQQRKSKDDYLALPISFPHLCSSAFICGFVFLPKPHRLTRCLFALLFLPATLFAQLEVIPAKEVPLVFSGKDQFIEIIFRNPTDETISTEVHTRLYQASFATLVPVGESKPWKQLQILSGQTIIETIAVDFPVIRAVTEFRLRFSDSKKQIADFKIRVAPDDLLKQLSALAEKTPVGIMDPDDQLKPLLEKNRVEFHDLEKDAGFDGFTGKLAIIGPFLSKDSVPENLGKRIAAKRDRPLAVIWIQPPDAKVDPLLPVYLVRENDNVIAIVQHGVIANLAESPKSQLNLLRAAQLALNPDSLRLPETENP